MTKRKSKKNPVVINFAGGVGSTAMLLAIAEGSEVPDAIVFVDKGADHPDTYSYIEETIEPLLEMLKFPPLQTLPHADGDQWIKNTFSEHLEAGGKIDLCQGYTTEEKNLAKELDAGELETRNWVNWVYPLLQEEWSQSDCEEKILEWCLDVLPRAAPEEDLRSPCPPPEPVVPFPSRYEDATDDWMTGNSVSLEGLAGFMHMVRGPNDPKRTPREARKGKETAWRGDLKKSSQPKWSKEIAKLMKDGEERTFNRICLEITDLQYTADACHGKAPDKALWALVFAGKIEHSAVVPILFRSVVAQS